MAGKNIEVNVNQNNNQVILTQGASNNIDVNVNQSTNQVILTKSTTNTVEVKTLGPQGQKGDTGVINPNDITGSLRITGSLTVSSSFVDFTNTTAISGSTFSGSFVGDGSGLSGVTGEWDGTLNGNAQITGALVVTETITALGVVATDIAATAIESTTIAAASASITKFITPITVNGNISSIGVNANISSSAILGGESLTLKGKSFVTFDARPNVFQVGGSGHGIQFLTPITASGNISSSGTVIGQTGSFGRLEGLSPITVGDSITFTQAVTASGDISSSGAVVGLSGSFTKMVGTVGDEINLNRIGVGSIGNENTPVTSSYIVTVATKTANHPYSGSGSNNGYLINGIEAPYLNVYVGRSYKFDQNDSTNNGHPFRFYLDVDKTTQYTTNVTFGEEPTYTQISITEDTPRILYYQCSVHGKMGNAIYVLGNQDGQFNGAITAGGNISSSSEMFAKEFNASGTDANSGFTFLNFGGKPSISTDGTNLIIGSIHNEPIKLDNPVTASGDISSSGTITANAFVGDGSGLTTLPSGTLSSSAQISTEISGAFTAVSGGFSSRVTTLEAGGLSIPAGTVSSSAQIATEISGAFTAPSASFSSRVTTLEAGGGSGGSGIFSATGSIQSTTNNLEITGSLTATGVITGNGSGLTNLSFTGKTIDQWDALLPPDIPNVLNDEFTSSLAGWSTYNTGSTPFTSSVDTIRRRLILEQNDLSGNDVLAGLYKSAPTASSGNYEYAVWTKTNLNTTDASNNPGAGLFVAEDIAVSASANVYAIVLQSWGSVYRTSFQTWSSFNNVTDTTTKYVYNKGQFQRIRVSYASSGNQSTVGFDFSEDGIGWFELDSATYSGHLPYIGLVVNNDASTKQLRGQFDYFRVYDDATFSYVPSGSIKRIGLIGDQGDNFTVASSSFSTRVTTLEAGGGSVPAGTVSSSAQIASDISGSFTAASASFSTRVTTLEAGGGSVPAGTVSSSAQIASDISGSFTAVSASFSTRVTANEAGGGGSSGIFSATGSIQSTTNNLEITGSLTVSGSVVDFTKATTISGSTFSGSFVGDGSGLIKNKYINNALINPTSFVWGNTVASLTNNRMYGLVYQIDQKIPIDGLTINKGTTNGGNMTAAIYKYNESTNLFDKIANTEVNTFNTSLSGFQTVSITPTTLEQGIYMNVMHADTSHGSFGGYQQPKLDPPLGRDASGAIISGLIRYSYTYAHPMTGSIAPDASFGWTVITNFYQKYASFLLNQV